MRRFAENSEYSRFVAFAHSQKCNVEAGQNMVEMSENYHVEEFGGKTNPFHFQNCIFTVRIKSQLSQFKYKMISTQKPLRRC